MKNFSSAMSLVLLSFSLVVFASCSNSSDSSSSSSSNSSTSSDSDSSSSDDGTPVVENLSLSAVERGAETTVTLTYTAEDNASACEIDDLTNLTETTECACDGDGACSVGVTSDSNFAGAVGFDYTVTVNDVESDVATVSYEIECTVSIQLGGAIQPCDELNLVTAVSTVAGDAGTSGSTDDTGTAAEFNSPGSITTDGTNLYIADGTNHTIRQMVISTGVVTTLAGTASSSGSTDGTGSAARFYFPNGITTDGTNLYVTDYGNQTIRQIVIATGVVTTLAGTVSSTGTTDGTGSAARFNYPGSITTDGTNLYVSDYLSHTIRKVVITTGVVTTLAGTAGASGNSNGTGTAASFKGPGGLTTDGTNLYVVDTLNHMIRKIVIASGVVTTVAGSSAAWGSTDDTGTAASFWNPADITMDGANLYVTGGANHKVRQIEISTNVVTTLAGSSSSGTTDDTGTAARFNTPDGITSDGTDLFIVDSGNHTIRKME